MNRRGIHRATFGDVSGAHNLVASSAEAPRRVLSELTPYTDRLLPADAPWQPYVCGFPLAGHYVVTRTFSVKASRGGMVQTHALLIPFSSLHEEVDLGRLFRSLPSLALPPGDNSWAQAQGVEGAASNDVVSPPVGVAQAVHNLVNGRSSVWSDQQAAENFLIFVWRQLWFEARSDLRFRAATEPADLQDFPAHVVSTLPTLVVNWPSKDVVGSDSIAPLQRSRSEALLLGLSEGNSIEAARLRLNIRLRLADLQRLDSYVTMTELQNADGNRASFRVLGMLAPEVEAAAAEKEKVLSALAADIATGTESGILALRNLYMVPFLDAERRIGAAIQQWLGQCASRGTGGSGAIVAALDVAGPWSDMVLRALRAVVSTWNRDLANLVWHWWEADGRLVSPVFGMVANLSSQAEEDLAQTMPAAIGDPLIESLLPLSRGEKWARLAAHLLAVSNRPPLDKLALQVEIDFESGTTAGIAIVAARVPPSDLVRSALELADPTLLGLAAGAAVSLPELMAACDPSTAPWRAIWHARLRSDTDAFRGIPSPGRTAHALFDELLAGVPIPPELQRIAADKRANLLGYHRRREIWSKLDPSTVPMARSATAEAWLESLLTTGSAPEPVEPELESAVVVVCRRRLGSIPLALLVSLIASARLELSEDDVIQWLGSFPSLISYMDASSLGTIVIERAWTSVAQHFFQAWRNGRADIVPAIQQCSSLLGFWDRGVFALRARVAAVTAEEWWAAFLELATNLYPRGVEERSIWDRAAGDLSQIRQGSGREEWAEALHLLRMGGAGSEITLSGLLHQMRKDFPQNQKLTTLEDLRYVA